MMESRSHENQQRAKQFAEKWSGKERLKEIKDSRDFINDFFGIFGIDCLSSNIIFEYKLNSSGSIDVFWPGVILIENKSPGSRLSQAFEQARNYYGDLEDYLKPKYILINNFNDFEIYTLKRSQRGKKNYWSKERGFSLNELSEHGNISLFYYFFDHKYEKVKKDREVSVDRIHTENSVNEELVEKLVEKRVKAIMNTIHYGILKLALVSSLFLTVGYIISDGQPREHLDSFIEGVSRDESTR